MNRDIEQHLDAIQTLCRQHRARRLLLIGSAARDDFDAQASDFDFVVEFDPFPRQGLRDPFFRLRQALEDLLGRSVDLIEFRAIDNPRFREAVEHDQQVLYAA